MATAASKGGGTEASAASAGPAHVAVVSFLAARAAPSGGFWIALAGGVALARVALRRGARPGFGASIAAMLETVAIIGPARFGIPLTQAATAPLLGRLEARGWPPLPQIVVCTVLRILHNGATTAFFIWVITGGLDAYAGTYDAIGRRVGLDVGTADALALTAAGLLVWGVFASVVQVLVYRRGLARWPDTDDARYVAVDNQRERTTHPTEAPAEHRGRFDPRAITLTAVVLFGVLLASTQWLVLGAVAVFLGLAWLVSRPDNEPLPTGILFAAILALGAFIFALGGGLGLEVALRRALRAALIVIVATWLRAAAGADGLREVFRRVLGRLRAIPSLPEAAAVLEGIAAEGRLAAAGRSLAEQLRDVRLRPIPFCDAVLGWVVDEARSFRPELPAAPARLALRPVDVALAVPVAAALAALALSG
jgi:hypothetical protein